ncbi:hypothetical protein K3495_g3776 [Podosphaera aphanis]|nr:hypothetical protein K3495_g3776 [Podosphaera aphanis]
MKLLKFNSENSEVFRRALTATAPPSLPSRDLTPQLLDAIISSSIATLSTILLTANPPRPICVPYKDYWNYECSDLRRRYLEARHSGDLNLVNKAYHNFRKAIRRAKREHKRSELDNVTSILESYKVVGWRKLSSRFGPPPIHFQGVTYCTLSRKSPPPIIIDGALRTANSNLKWLGVFLYTKLSFKKNVQEWSAKTLLRIRNLPPRDILVFSDGSKQKDGSARAGAVVFLKVTTVAEVKVPLGFDSVVYDSEIVGALAGLKAAIAAPSTHLATNIHKEILEFRHLASHWPTRRILPTAAPRKVFVMWSTGHSGIPGNDRADNLAGEASRQTAPSGASLASIQAKIKKQIWELTPAWWQSHAPSTYCELGMPFPKKPPEELRLPRRNLGYLIQCRTGHGDFRAYHDRFHHKDALTTCSCGGNKSSIHLAFCPLVRENMAAAGYRRSFGSLDFLLGTAHGAKRFSLILEKTGFLSDICPVYAA